ncbi:hypothetical protein U1Q18_045338 [Sarracenia purpurea var. burkii]
MLLACSASVGFNIFCCLISRYVHNNIFFSFAVDADLEQLSKKRTSDSNPKIESTSSLHNPSDKTFSKLSNAAARASGGDKSNGTSTEDPDSGTDSTSDVRAETQLAESEQAIYASANNDLKGTKTYQEADVSGLYNLAMAIIDYKGHRVVAQSVLPGILQGDKSDSLLYGSVDNGKKICWNEDFHSKVLEAAKSLHLKEHTVFDGSGNVFKLAAPVECKGIVGCDDRHYLLDLMRATPRDANYTGPGSRFCILRPELISAFCQVEAVKRPKSSSKSKGELSGATNSVKVDSAEEQMVTEADTPLETSETSDTQVNLDGLVCLYSKVVPQLEVGFRDGNKGNTARNVSKEDKHEADLECGSASLESGEMCEETSFNPNVFTEFKLAGRKEEISADEENVRKASLYLNDTVLPKFIQDLCTLEVSPMDGQTLTEALHAHGINLRYIGKVAEGTKHLPHLWDLCSNEIVVRSAKHILKDVLRDSDDHDIGPAISHFFNCFFGKFQAAVVKGTPNGMQSRAHKKDHAVHQASGKSSRGQARWNNGGSSRKKHSSYSNIMSDSLWSDILEFAKIKYQYELPEDARSRVKKISVVRNLCQKVGITIAARKYDLDAVAPFQTSDFLDLSSQ